MQTIDRSIDKMGPKYLNYYSKKANAVTANGRPIEIFELDLYDDEEILNEWANHFRVNYCALEEIDLLRSGYGISREEYLLSIKFPSENEDFGPATRSGDFTELLLADYVEFVLSYYVPRTRYDRKITKNSSSQGSDLIAFKKKDTDTSPSDELLVYEVKGQATNTTPQCKLQNAINDSKKDIKRIAESLNAINQRLIDKGNFEDAKIIQRFQNATDRPYKRVFAAAAVHSKHSFSRNKVEESDTSNHIDPDIKLIVIYSENLMDRIHDIYRRAAKC